MNEGFRQSEDRQSSTIERIDAVWRKEGPNALAKLREEKFFDQFGIDIEALIGVIMQYCTGQIDAATVNDFFDRNSESKLVGQTFGEGRDEYTVTCVGHDAKQMIFARLEQETGQTWWEK